jgi:hypothetical protein
VDATLPGVKGRRLAFVAVAVAAGASLLCCSEPFSAAPEAPAAGVAEGGAPDAASEGGDAAPPAAYPAVVLEDRPVAYFRFDDPASITDVVTGKRATAWGAPGTAAGALVGDQDGSFDFEGHEAAIVPVPAWPLEGTRPFSFEAWIFLAESTNDFRHALYFGDGAGASRDAVGLYEHTGEGLVFERWANGGKLSVATAAALFGWYHVVATYDGLQLALFVDGRLVDTLPDARAHVSPLRAPVVLGAKGTTVGASGWRGRLDEVAFYDKALSSPRILRHYQVGLGLVAGP